MADKMKITVLPDGLLKVETDKVSMPNHANAEAFVREMARLQGGKTDMKHKHGATGHTHSHSHGEEEHHHH